MKHSKISLEEASQIFMVVLWYHHKFTEVKNLNIGMFITLDNNLFNSYG